MFLLIEQLSTILPLNYAVQLLWSTKMLQEKVTGSYSDVTKRKHRRVRYNLAAQFIKASQSLKDCGEDDDYLDICHASK